jgi:hypothetical protein
MGAKAQGEEMTTKNSMQVSAEIKLLAKLHRITTALEPIVKKGYNAFHKYKYATEFDVLTALREQFTKEKLLILPDTESTNYDPNSGITTVRVRYRIYDTETGAVAVSIFEGQGADKQDKGIYKAYTGCMKYFLLKTFQIPTTDDPENDKGNKYDFTQPQTEEEKPPATEKQIDLVNKLKNDTSLSIPEALMTQAQDFLMFEGQRTKRNAGRIINELMKCPQRSKQ